MLLVADLAFFAEENILFFSFNFLVCAVYTSAVQNLSVVQDLSVFVNGGQIG